MSSRRKKKLARVYEDKPLELPGAEPEIKSQHEYICEGCKKIATVQDSVLYECPVYAFVPPYYINQGCCYFNRPASKKKAVGAPFRVGQQKTKRMGG
jgi:hypothetical protein